MKGINTRRWKWWQIALASVVISGLGSLSGGLRSKKQRQQLQYRKLKQAPWAPPGWLFAPAWTFNNFCLLLGIQRLLERDIPEKRKLLLLQGGIWLIFFSFNYIYFNKKSTVLAAVWTKSDAILALASFLIAYKGDKKIAISYLPLLLWTVFASSVADYQALKNEDPYLKTRPLLEYLNKA